MILQVLFWPYEFGWYLSYFSQSESDIKENSMILLPKPYQMLAHEDKSWLNLNNLLTTLRAHVLVNND